MSQLISMCSIMGLKTIQFCSSALPLFLCFSLNICIGSQVNHLTVHIASFWKRNKEMATKSLVFNVIKGHLFKN